MARDCAGSPDLQTDLTFIEACLPYTARCHTTSACSARSAQKQPIWLTI